MNGEFFFCQYKRQASVYNIGEQTHACYVYISSDELMGW